MPTEGATAVLPGRLPGFFEFVAMIAALMALTALSIDIMLPALPQIGNSFAIFAANDRQLVVTAYMLGFAFGQILYGPLSDRFGRRKILLIGLGFYALASLLCLAATSFSVFLAARGLQGIANAAPRVVAMAVVRDLYSGRRMAQVMSFVMMIFIILPIVAPSIGSSWLAIGSWRMIFAFLFGLALIILAWTAWRLPETHPPQRRMPLNATRIGRAFLLAVSNRQTLGYTLAIGSLFGAMLAYIHSAQQVFTEVYGLDRWFPVAFGCVALGLACASLINSRLVVRIGMRRLSHGAAIGFVMIAACHLGIAQLAGNPPLPVFMALMAICLFFFGFMMPNYNALAMEPMGLIAGTASSFIGATTTGIGALLGWSVGRYYAGTALPLILGIFIFGLVSLGLVLATERGRLFDQKEM